MKTGGASVGCAQNRDHGQSGALGLVSLAIRDLRLKHKNGSQQQEVGKKKLVWNTQILHSVSEFCREPTLIKGFTVCMLFRK